MKIIVDLDVWNCTIRVAKPADQNDPCPTDQIGKMIWYESVSGNRLNDRIWGDLRGKALRKAEKIIEREGGINVSGWYGSIEIDEKDFVERKK